MLERQRNRPNAARYRTRPSSPVLALSTCAWPCNGCAKCPDAVRRLQNRPTMRVLVACDSFKECCSAITVCRSIANGLRHSDVEVDLCPLADGGEGTLDAIAQATPINREPVSVTGPFGEPVLAEVSWFEGPLPLSAALAVGEGRVALIESASCIGLGLVPEAQRNPLLTTSYGLGELILHAERRGAEFVVVALGGSSTVDGGIGMAQALGVRIRGIRTPASGADLGHVSGIDPIGPLAPREFRVLLATDVRSPLLGAKGAARVFAPQKGATVPMVEVLEHGMTHYSRQLFQACRARSEHVQPTKLANLGEAVSSPGAGAAGGIGFALQQLFGATATSGADLVMQLVNFEQRLDKADLVITGEGRLDDTSFEGKVVSRVLSRAIGQGVPVHVICGSSTMNSNDWQKRGIARVRTLVDRAADVEDAKRRAEELLAAAAAGML